MQTIIRHLGIPVQSMKQATEFWDSMGFGVVAMSNETWGDKKLNITKMGDVYGSQIELVKGDWPYHVAVGVNEFPQGLEMIHYKAVEKHEVAFFRVPGGGIVEMVRVR